MDTTRYDMIFKRKSFHMFHFSGNSIITTGEYQDIQAELKALVPLDPDLKMAIQILPSNKTSCKRGQEYCIAFYSEKKGNYLQNIGYMGEQLDLFLTAMNIGTLWFGIGNVKEREYQELDFIIMIAIKKVSVDKFRKDMMKSKRKAVDDIWNGIAMNQISNIVRFAPSACNSQPWLVDHKGDELFVYRLQSHGRKGIMPADKVAYYNRIDMGIFLLFLETCLQHEGIDFNRTLFPDLGETNEKTKVASYHMHRDTLT